MAAILHEVEVESLQVIRVINIRDMADDIFVRHMNKRHSGSLGGLSELPDGMDPYVMGLYRSYHGHLHGILEAYYPEMDHDHDG